jgi:hypothetical protein
MQNKSVNLKPVSTPAVLGQDGPFTFRESPIPDY